MRAHQRSLTSGPIFALSPRATRPVHEERPLRGLTPNTPDMAQASTPHLLIVEDHPVFRRFLVSWLSRHYRVSSVASGIEALRWLQSGEETDALLLDLDMPGVSGWQVAQNMRASGLFGALPIVAMTAEATAAVRERAAGLRVAEVFSRPYRPNDVLRALAEATGRRPAVPLRQAA